MFEKKRRLHLEITGACNLECRYCYNSGFNNPTSIIKELSIKEQLVLIKQSIDLGCTSFCFSGGEPFLNPMIMDLINACPESGRVSIITNASQVNGTVINELSKFKQMRELKISLDGFQAHDNIRKGSSHLQVLETIELVNQNIPHCKVIVNTMINEYSICELLELYRRLKTLDVKHWRIDMPFNLGRCSANFPELMDISFKEIILVYRDLLLEYFAENKPMILEVFNVYKSQIKIDAYYQFDENIHPCAYYNDTITVRPDGNLTYCPSLAFPIADWRATENLNSALESAYQHEYFSLTLHQMRGCSMCRYLQICGGGCRADAITWINDAYAPDPISCAIMPLIEKYILPILPDDECKMYKKLIDPSKEWPKQNAQKILDFFP